MKKNTKIFLILSIIPIWIFSLIISMPHESNYWLSFWWMFPISLIIAITVNTVGISGSALFIPFFILLFPFLADPLTTGQSIMLGLITESFGLSSSALAFFWFGLIDKKMGFRTILISSPFVITGSVLSFYIPDNILRFVVAIALMIVVLLMLNKRRKESKKECIECNKIGTRHKHISADNMTLTDKAGKIYTYCRFCGMKKRLAGYALGGLFQGSAGFGIGELGILSMTLTDIPIRVAIGTSHLIVASTAIIAATTHIIQTVNTDISIPWNILIATVPAVLIGGQIAPYISSRLKSNFLEHFILVLFSVISLMLIWITVF